MKKREGSEEVYMPLQESSAQPSSYAPSERGASHLMQCSLAAGC